MRFVITDVRFGACKNKKIAELHEQYRNTEMLILPSDEVRSQFIEEIKQTVSELDSKYPKTKKLNYHSTSGSPYKNHDLWIIPEGEDSAVLSFIIKKIRGTYDGKENTNAPERE